jgi:hypothetical protein
MARGAVEELYIQFFLERPDALLNGGTDMCKLFAASVKLSSRATARKYLR